MIVIREVIHHGDYQSTTDHAVLSLTPADMQYVLLDSPYHYTGTPANGEKLSAALIKDGEASHGWSRYTVVSR